MKKVCLIGIMAVLAMVLMFNPVSAALISMDWETDGDNNITYDSDTNLEWLDLSVTLGISTDTMLAEFSSGGEYYGFRYATLSELNVLLDNSFGVEPSNPTTGFTTEENVMRVKEMHNLFGGVFRNLEYWYLWEEYTAFGYIVDALTDQVWHQVYGHRYVRSNPPGYQYITDIWGANCGEGDFQDSQYGHFLVKDTVAAPVPEPATILLLGTGLLGLVGIGHKQIGKG